jgi:hypothetical protein
LFLAGYNGVNMRESTAAVAARKTPRPDRRGGQAPLETVCAALALAILVLACRIASIW